jgi:hypothetical protein
MWSAASNGSAMANILARNQETDESMKFPEQFRVKNAARGLLGSRQGDPFGAFIISPRSACGRELQVIAVDGQETGWEHVSVSLTGQQNKCPSWLEMCAVKSFFWDPVEVVIQVHPAEVDYVNNHPGCLHLWRSTKAIFPLPPPILVGVKRLNQLAAAGVSSGRQ